MCQLEMDNWWIKRMITTQKIVGAKQKKRGFTLLEVLVALLLLSLAFAGTLILQYKSVQFSSISYYRGISSQIINGLASSMRANQEGAHSYQNAVGFVYASSGGIAPPSSSCMGNTTCSAEEIAQEDIYWARKAARAQLPGGDLYIEYNASDSYFDAVILWEDPDSNGLTKLPCKSSISGLTTSTTCLSMRVRL